MPATATDPAVDVAAVRTQMGRPPGPGKMTEVGIVAAARQIIAEQGTDGLTMRVLSAKLDVSLGATYRRVATRSDILALVALDLFEQVEAATPADLDWLDRIRALILAYAEVFGAHPGMAAFVMDHSNELSPTGLTAVILKAMADGGLSGQRAAAVNAAVFFFVGGTTAAGVSSTPRSPVEVWRDDRFHEGLEVLLKGINAVAEEPVAEEPVSVT
jgi:TetR/AcrR family transcriptional regulator, tetracycline repressor protein